MAARLRRGTGDRRAFDLAAEHSGDRVATADALLALAGSADLDATALGKELGLLASDGQLKLSRAIEPLTQIAAIAPAVAARIALEASLPLLRAPKPPVATADLLALASRHVAPGSAVAPEIPAQISAVAGRGGSTRLVTEARRLHRVLTG